MDLQMLLCCVAKFECVIIENTILCDVLHLYTWCNCQTDWLTWLSDWLVPCILLFHLLKMMFTWLSKTFSAVYEIWNFITMFTSVRHWYAFIVAPAINIIQYNTIKHACDRNGRDRNFVSVAGSFHLVQVLELGSLRLQTLGTVNFFC